MSKVFIANYTNNDYSKAKQFGALVPVTVGTVNVFNPEAVRDQCMRELSEFDASADYFMLAGAAMACAFSVLALRDILTDGEAVNLLLWDSKKQEYFVKKVEL